MNPEEKLAAKRNNERVRLFAGAANNLAVGILAGAVVVPAANAQVADAPVHWIWIPAGLALHIVAQASFRFLKRED